RLPVIPVEPGDRGRQMLRWSAVRVAGERASNALQARIVERLCGAEALALDMRGLGARGQPGRDAREGERARARAQETPPVHGLPVSSRWGRILHRMSPSVMPGEPRRLPDS